MNNVVKFQTPKSVAHTMTGTDRRESQQVRQQYLWTIYSPTTEKAFAIQWQVDKGSTIINAAFDAIDYVHLIRNQYQKQVERGMPTEYANVSEEDIYAL